MLKALLILTTPILSSVLAILKDRIMSTASFLFIFSSSFMALFPVVNPIGGAFIVNGFFSNLDDKHRKIAIKKLLINYLLIGLGTLAVGHLFLLLFGLAVPVIQLGGGLLICKAAIDLLMDAPEAAQKSESEKSVTASQWSELESKLFYPITFPISVDPGSISVIFTLMATASVKDSMLDTGINYMIIATVFVCMAAILYLLLTQGQRFFKRLGDSGNLVINKLIAFFTFCVGIQIMVEGIAKIFNLDISIFS